MTTFPHTKHPVLPRAAGGGCAFCTCVRMRCSVRPYRSPYRSGCYCRILPCFLFTSVLACISWSQGSGVRQTLPGVLTVTHSAEGDVLAVCSTLIQYMHALPQYSCTHSAVLRVSASPDHVLRKVWYTCVHAKLNPVQCGQSCMPASRQLGPHPMGCGVRLRTL